MKNNKEYTMHFDIAIQNPPYDRNLHLKVLEQVLKVADKVINISPVRWLQDPFAPYLNKSDYNKFEESVSKHIKDIQFIPAKEATELFGDASFTMNLGIYELDVNGGWNYQHNDPLVNKMVHKTMQSSWSNFSWQDYYAGNIPVKAFKLNVAPIHSKDSKYPIMCQTYEDQCKTQPAKKRSDGNGGMGHNGGHFEFDTEEERKNFYDCYNTAFMQWYIKLWKFDVNVVGYKLPYFGDYTHQWKLRDFFVWFDLTPAERTRVVKEIRDMRHAKFH
jgi:hypothetical protein